MLVTEAAQNLALRTIFMLGMVVGVGFWLISKWLLLIVLIVSIVFTFSRARRKEAIQEIMENRVQDLI